MPKRRTWSDEQLIKAVQESRSVGQVLAHLGLRAAGGNYLSIRRHIVRLGIDASHFTGQSWSKDKKLLDKHRSNIASKRWMVRERGHTCEWCLLTEWRQRPIPLEVDHIDGNRLNNDPTNLRLLCPNCHSQTPTYRNRTRKW